MDINWAVEKEEEKLDSDYENGLIDKEEHERALNDLYADAREAIREEAEEAYNQVMNGY